MDILFSRCQCNLCFYKWFGLLFFLFSPFIHSSHHFHICTSDGNKCDDKPKYFKGPSLLPSFLFFSFYICFAKKKTDSNFSFNDILFSFGGAQECYKCKSARWAIKSRSGNLHELINSRREVESFFFFLVLFVAQKMVQPLFFHEYFNSFSILHPTTTSSFPIKQLKISTISHE